MSERQPFNLVEERWIRVLWLDGSVRDVSLRELFTAAQGIRCLVGDVPTQSFALLRLLLAIVGGARRGLDEAAWSKLWQDEALPVEGIMSYLAGHHDRFDLLHPLTPFYQVADLHTAKNEIKGLEVLIADVPTGEPFFTTRSGSGLDGISLAEAARWLVHCQAFDVSGIKSGAVGDGRVKNGKGYAIGTGFAGNLGGLYAEGGNLKETILLNLIPDGESKPRRTRADAPVWERLPLTSEVETLIAADGTESGRLPLGPLDLFTWQSRRIRLFTTGDQVTGALVCNGDKLTGHDLHDWEPMTAWRRSKTQEKKLGRDRVYLPRRHDPARALWRGLEAILPSTAGRTVGGDKWLDPLLMEWLAVVSEYLPSETQIRLRSAGVEYGTQQAVVAELIDDSVTMNVRLLNVPALARTAIDSAHDAETAVDALCGLARNLSEAAGDRDWEGFKVQTAELAYAELDRHFRDWLSRLNANSDPVTARRAWQQQVGRQIRRLARELVDATGPSPWVGRTVNGRPMNTSKAEIFFRSALRKALSMAYSEPREVGAS